MADNCCFLLKVRNISTSFIILTLLCGFCTISKQDGIENIEVQDLPKVLKDSCVLGIQPHLSSYQTIRAISHAFAHEPLVRIASISNKNEDNKNIHNYMKLKERMYESTNTSLNAFVFFPRTKVDRTCLLSPPVKHAPLGESISGLKTEKDLLTFLNSRCGTFRQLDGDLDLLGKRKEDILSNIFRVPQFSCSESDVQHETSTIQISSRCEYIDMPEKEEFLHRYLFRSKPVIVRGAARNWPAMKKWTNEFLVNQFGKNQVHIKLAPNGEFEGCDKAVHFENFKTFKIPEFVKAQLEHDDLVVVRPATMDINFASFMNLLDMSKTDKKYSNVSVYLEYSSIPEHMPGLEKDVKEMPFVSSILNRKHLNLWLSNGNTVGKLHFDPFDNVLAQITGTKEFILYEPFDNTRLYEGHIQEALLGFSSKSGEFRNQTLLDTTSMVMSPVDITNPDYQRFPKFKEASAMNCTVQEGDVLFMPAFWWHEVRSHPGVQVKRNMAVNFWYEPFMKKEFPCSICKMDINPTYYHLFNW